MQFRWQRQSEVTLTVEQFKNISPNKYNLSQRDAVPLTMLLLRYPDTIVRVAYAYDPMT